MPTSQDQEYPLHRRNSALSEPQQEAWAKAKSCWDSNKTVDAKSTNTAKPAQSTNSRGGSSAPQAPSRPDATQQTLRGTGTSAAPEQGASGRSTIDASVTGSSKESPEDAKKRREGQRIKKLFNCTGTRHVRVSETW